MVKEYITITSYIFSILASIFIILSVIIKESPIWLLYVGIGLAIIFSLIPLYPKIKFYFNSKFETNKKNKLVRKYFPEFEELIDSFSKYMDGNRSDNIPSVLKSIKQSSSKDYETISLLSIHNLSSIFYYFKEIVKNFKGKSNEFILLVKMFYEILNIYNKDYVCSSIAQIKNVKKGIREDDQEEYKKCKHEYITFLEECKKFGKKIENEFGENIRIYFDFPKDI